MSDLDHLDARVPLARSAPRRAPSAARAALTGGGTEGNEQLTAMVAVVLLVLLAALGVTILRIGQLIWLHLFLGLLLLGPVAAKMGSTGYRFAHYYARSRGYFLKGAPPPIMRLIAPIVVLSTIVVFISGMLLLIDGPQPRDSFLLIHKASFVIWLGFVGLHVLGHLPGLGTTLRAAGPGTAATGGTAGSAGRWITLAGAVVAGLVLAIVLIPQYDAWTASHAFLRHHH